MTNPEFLDVVIRFHDMRRLAELERAVFSLVMQRYRHINIILATQRFSEVELEQTRAHLAHAFSIAGAPTLTVVNFTESEPHDARSILVNLGIQRGRGRYLSFLDYDDVLYPEAYELLIPRVRDTGAAIAFGGIVMHHVDIFPAFSHRKGSSLPFRGQDVFDLFQDNFCPIHSFVVDRSKVREQDLFFEPFLTRAEDYDFLLRICARYLADFSLCKTIIGAYAIKNDGSNTTLDANSSSEMHASWEDASHFVEGRRRTTTISSEVQRAMGLQPDPQLTIHGLLRKGRKR